MIGLQIEDRRRAADRQRHRARRRHRGRALGGAGRDGRARTRVRGHLGRAAPPPARRPRRARARARDRRRFSRSSSGPRTTAITALFRGWGRRSGRARGPRSTPPCLGVWLYTARPCARDLLPGVASAALGVVALQSIARWIRVRVDRPEQHVPDLRLVDRAARGPAAGPAPVDRGARSNVVVHRVCRRRALAVDLGEPTGALRLAARPRDATRARRPRWLRGRALGPGRLSRRSARPGRLDHEDHGALRRRVRCTTPAAPCSPGAGRASRCRPLDVDQQPALEDEEELVLVVVLVPVEVAVEDAQADDRVVDRRERLVEPGLVRAASAATSMRVRWPNFSSRWMS